MHSSPIRSSGAYRVRTPLALPRQRIGLLGGSFNPPHEGHRIVALTALKRLELGAVWWVVTPGNPLKARGGQTGQAARMEASRAFVRHRRMIVTGFEAELGTPYTVATLMFLKRRFPTTRLVWLMGADNLATFDRWRHWRTIARIVPICVVDRPGWRFKALASPAARALWRWRIPEAKAGLLAGMKPPAWTFLTTRLSQESSTELRDKVAQMSH